MKTITGLLAALLALGVSATVVKADAMPDASKFDAQGKVNLVCVGVYGVILTIGKQTRKAISRLTSMKCNIAYQRGQTVTCRRWLETTSKA